MDGPSFVSPNTSFENNNGKVMEGQSVFDYISVPDPARPSMSGAELHEEERKHQAIEFQLQAASQMQSKQTMDIISEALKAFDAKLDQKFERYETMTNDHLEIRRKGSLLSNQPLNSQNQDQRNKLLTQRSLGHYKNSSAKFSIQPKPTGDTNYTSETGGRSPTNL